MTLLDLVALLVILVYAVLGWVSGTIRRVIGLAGAYIALLVASNMGQQGADILRQYSPTIGVPDARLYSWFFFLVLLLLAFEGAATAVHRQVQLAVVALNRAVGLLLGLVTAVVVLVACAYMLLGFANASTNQATGTQVNMRDQLQHSGVLLPLATSTGPVILPLLTATLPRDSASFFVATETKPSQQ